MAQTVSCPNCKRSYAVKPELAGKRVKCKCGERIDFPALETPEVEALTELDLLDEKPKSKSSSESRGAFETLEQPTDYSAGKPAAPAPASGGAVCTNCKAALAPGAVICTQCGCNQRTGSVIRTQVVRGAPPPMASAPGQRQYAAASASTASPTDSELGGTDWLLIVLCGGIAFIMGIVYMVQGKPKGLKMILAVIVIQAICGGIGVIGNLSRHGT